MMFNSDKARRNEAWFLLLLYVSFSMIAALGTWTVGTAIRHQIKASWILIILGAPILNRWVGIAAPSKHAAARE